MKPGVQRLIFGTLLTLLLPFTLGAQNFVYVTNQDSNSVSVIDTSDNSVLTTIGLPRPLGVAITPDGSRVYVAGYWSNSFSVIDTSSNTVVATVSVGSLPYGVAITPDGSRVYLTDFWSDSVSVIDTSSNTVVATVAVGSSPDGVAITPDGRLVYVANRGTSSVSVIDTASNTVVATVPLGSSAYGVAITPTPFSALSAKLNVFAAKGRTPASFDLKGAFTVAAAGGEINPLIQALTLQLANWKVTVPAGSFQQKNNGRFDYAGTINGVWLNVKVKSTGAQAYDIKMKAEGIDLTDLTNPVTIRLSTGNNTGAASVTADFKRRPMGGRNLRQTR
jgi:YVTN family beta-propeller protein